jgi:hypothetical protein
LALPSLSRYGAPSLIAIRPRTAAVAAGDLQLQLRRRESCPSRPSRAIRQRLLGTRIRMILRARAAQTRRCVTESRVGGARSHDGGPLRPQRHWAWSQPPTPGRWAHLGPLSGRAAIRTPGRSRSRLKSTPQHHVEKPDQAARVRPPRGESQTIPTLGASGSFEPTLTLD